MLFRHPQVIKAINWRASYRGFQFFRLSSVDADPSSRVV
jgi:hypothetical protein